MRDPELVVGDGATGLWWSGRGRGPDLTVVASRFETRAKFDRTLASDAGLELVDSDHEMARGRAAAIARYGGIRLVEDRLDIATCEGAATIGLELVPAETAPSFGTVLTARWWRTTDTTAAPAGSRSTYAVDRTAPTPAAAGVMVGGP